MFITVRSNNSRAASYPLGLGHMVIGRDPACDVRLADLRASRRHACIHRLGTRFAIEDLRSGQGTVVNGRTVTRHYLKHGDRIQLGDTEIAVVKKELKRPLNASTETAADLLHDLRNPLAIIQLTHQSILDHLESAALRGDDRESLEELLANMKVGIDQFRDLLR